jgi:ATP-grasp domain, R2K clade family 2
VSDHALAICSEVVTWQSEYRVYVARGQILGTRHYLGDPNVPLDGQEIATAVAEYEASGEATAGYGIDFGVLGTGQTALIEVNDGYALGSYGLEDDLYTDLLIARWCQLVGLAR